MVLIPLPYVTTTESIDLPRSHQASDCSRDPSGKQTIEWARNALEMLPDEPIRKSFEMCARSNSLNMFEDDDEIVCIKYDPHEV